MVQCVRWLQLMVEPFAYLVVRGVVDEPVDRAHPLTTALA